MFTVSIVDNRLNNNASTTAPVAETYQNVLYFKEEKAAFEAFEREAKAAENITLLACDQEIISIRINLLSGNAIVRSEEYKYNPEDEEFE